MAGAVNITATKYFISAVIVLVVVALLAIRSRSNALTCPNGTPTPTPTSTPTSTPTPPPPNGNGITVATNGTTIATVDPGWSGSEGLGRNNNKASVVTSNGLHSSLINVTFGQVFIGTSITESGYRTALNAGCQSGSQCDPSTWNFAGGMDNDAGQAISVARAQGFHIAWMILYGYPSSMTGGVGCGGAGNPNCQPTDAGVFEDIIKKITLHIINSYQGGALPEWVQVSNEPNIGGGQMFLNPTGTVSGDYPWYYFHMANGIRAANSSILIGGPCSTDSEANFQPYIQGMKQSGLILDNQVNIIAIHNYSGDNASLYINDAAPYYPNHQFAVTEWNVQRSCGSPNYSDVGAFGFYDLEYVALGWKDYMFEWNGNLSNQEPCAGFDASGNPLNHIYIYNVLWNDLGLQGGDLVKPSSTQAVSIGFGGVNSAGHPYAVMDNYQANGGSVTATFTGLTPNSSHTASAYQADNNGNHGQSVFASGAANADSSGKAQFTVTNMTNSGVLGVILNP